RRCDGWYCNLDQSGALAQGGPCAGPGRGTMAGRGRTARPRARRACGGEQGWRSAGRFASACTDWSLTRKSRSMNFIDAATVGAALGYPKLVDVLDEAFRRGAISPPRHHHTVKLDGRPDATFLLMPAWTSSAA